MREDNNGMVQLSTRIPTGLMREVKLAAIAEGLTLSGWVTEAITRFLETHERKSPKE